MRKYILSITAACSLFILTTQTYAQKGFDFGIRYMVTKSALFNTSDKDAGPELDRSSTTSYLSGGFAFGYSFNRHMGAEVDLLYSRQGQEYSGVNMQTANTAAYNHVVALQAMLNNSTSTGAYQAKAELNCIKIPLLLKLTTDNSKASFFTLSFGPQLNLLKSAVYELNNADIELPGINITPDDTYKKATIDGVVAFGAGFNLSRNFVLSAQARFDYGFQDVEKKDVSYYYNNVQQNYYGNGRASTHNGTAALQVGLSYKL